MGVSIKQNSIYKVLHFYIDNILINDRLIDVKSFVFLKKKVNRQVKL